MNPVTVAFFGISGAGKGTQCDLLQAYLEKNDSSRAIVRPEMGRLGRSFSQTGTSLAKLTGDVMAKGGILPSFVPTFLLANMLNETFTGTEHVMLDGTCRRPAQSQAVDEMMRFWGRTNLHGVVFEVSEATAHARLNHRGRADDLSPEVVASRFAWYKEFVVPAEKALEECGWTMHTIDAEPDPETIHQAVLKALGI